MRYEKNDLIKLSNSEEYMIVDIFNTNNTRYLFLVNYDDNKKNIALVKEICEDGKVFIDNIETEEEFKSLIANVSEKYKNEILEIFNNKI